MFLRPNVPGQSCTHITVGVGNDILAEVAMLKELSGNMCDTDDLENSSKGFECSNWQ